MAGLGAAVTILTTDGPAGRHGLTATAVCSATDDPPTLIACLNRGSGAFGKYLSNGRLGVNVLGDRHLSLSNRFARTSGDGVDRFAHGSWASGNGGAPLLEDALVAIDARISSHVVVGTHVILFAEVLSVRSGSPSSPLLYFDRRYHVATTFMDLFDSAHLPVADDIMF